MTSEPFKELPDNHNLRRICKAVSVLDAIVSQEPENRYYTYNAHWGEGEEIFEMRNGEGDQLLILFRDDGCVINGFCHESKQPLITMVTKGLPPVFNEFIFGEPIKSIGTTFCIWWYEKSKWRINKATDSNACIKEMLYVFDGNPATYTNWANEYYTNSYREPGISTGIVQKLYNEEPLTKEMVLTVINKVKDWDLLQSDMEQIDYITDFKIK
ncbi:MAG: hypothetical protein ACXVNM_08430 [Bacteroidia bacterium]